MDACLEGFLTIVKFIRTHERTHSLKSSALLKWFNLLISYTLNPKLRSVYLARLCPGLVLFCPKNPKPRSVYLARLCVRACVVLS